MIIFPIENISGTDRKLEELAFKDALAVSVVEPKLNEKRISVFLSKALKCDIEIVRNMSVQERYFLNLKYACQQSRTLLGMDSNFSSLFNEQPNSWQDQINLSGITVRQLTGREAEYIEENVNNAAEWIACLLAFQIKYHGHAELSNFPDRTKTESEFIEEFLQRLDYLKNLAESDFEKCFGDFNSLNELLCTHLNLGISNEGLVLKRGADDAPVRFCPASCLSRLIRDLD
ncbi:hypothetical protein [Acinetobacter chinensis]|uniref:hypothetical protein n=1 Tax=Acinetobacter chinensis TaxID=2004650 RepID=UPI0029349380|nr:hypothetical protein [Acinetobacter chinensis]WOE40043.1 hypothetical protein QSG87_08965 [Acinetobacter chinensis]